MGRTQELESETVFGDYEISVEKASTRQRGNDTKNQYYMEWDDGSLTFRGLNTTKREAIEVLRRFFRSFGKEPPSGDFDLEKENYNNDSYRVEPQLSAYEWITREKVYSSDEEVPWEFLHSNMRIDVKPADRNGSDIRIYYDILVRREHEVIEKDDEMF